MSATREQLVEALRRALGARWARVARKGDTPPAEPAGLLRRQQHLLTVDVRGTDPPLQLQAGMPRAPTIEDTVLASAVARSFAGEQRTARPAIGPVVDALTASGAGRADAILAAAVALSGAAAGGLVLRGAEDVVATHGSGRAVLRRAALAAAGATTDEITVDGKAFLVAPLPDGTGALALERGRATDDLSMFVAALRPVQTKPAPAVSPAPTQGDASAVASSLPIAAFLVDASGRLAGVSPQAEHLLGVTADFDLGVPIAGKLGSAVLEDVASGRSSAGPVAIAGVVYDAAAADLPSGGRLITLQDSSRDMQLAELQDDLVSTVAHELRTPVAALTALIQLLRLRGSAIAQDKLALLLADGEREVARLERMVEDLLLTARIATGGIVARPGEVAVEPIASDVVRLLSSRYPDHAFSVAGEADAYADPTLVRHALWHLVDNAGKYSAAGSRVAVTIRDAASGVEIEVSDEGEGILTGDIPALFDRFRQLDASATRRHGGSGLGLFIVKRVTEAQGGHVWVRSRLGQGSTFSLRLPAASAGGQDDDRRSAQRGAERDLIE